MVYRKTPHNQSVKRMHKAVLASLYTALCGVESCGFVVRVYGIHVIRIKTCVPGGAGGSAGVHGKHDPVSLGAVGDIVVHANESPRSIRSVYGVVPRECPYECHDYQELSCSPRTTKHETLGA